MIDTDNSTFEEQSVGRIYIKLAKKVKPSRWARIQTKVEDKQNNSQIWWEMHDKYQEELEGFQPEQDDDFELPKKKKSKKKKSKRVY